MRMSTKRTGGISIVVGEEEVATGGEIEVGDRVGKEVLLDEGVCLGSQSSMDSVGRE